MHVRGIAIHDVEAVLAIQAACPEIAQWSAWDYESVARGEMAGWVAEDERGIAGFLVARRLVGEAEILNFAVRADSRRQGTGTALLQQALVWSKSIGAERVILEVRASNVAAIRFYERHGFVVAGKRVRYYAAPVEDALLLNLSLAKSGGN
jgi:[ribosomal protein S18]-alanine N-acetyltransferase